MFIVCYIDTADNNCKFMKTANYKSLLENTPQHMDIKYIFREKANIADRLNTYELNFIQHHRTYGFSISDLHRHYENTQSHCKYELMGLNMKNTRYKLIIMDLETKKLCKVDIGYLDTYCREIS